MGTMAAVSFFGLFRTSCTVRASCDTFGQACETRGFDGRLTHFAKKLPLQPPTLFPERSEKLFDLFHCEWRGFCVPVFPPIHRRERNAQTSGKLLLTQPKQFSKRLHQSALVF